MIFYEHECMCVRKVNFLLFTQANTNTGIFTRPKVQKSINGASFDWKTSNRRAQRKHIEMFVLYPKWSTTCQPRLSFWMRRKVFHRLGLLLMFSSLLFSSNFPKCRMIVSRITISDWIWIKQKLLMANFEIGIITIGDSDLTTSEPQSRRLHTGGETSLASFEVL